MGQYIQCVWNNLTAEVTEFYYGQAGRREGSYSDLGTQKMIQRPGFCFQPYYLCDLGQVALTFWRIVALYAEQEQNCEKVWHSLYIFKKPIFLQQKIVGNYSSLLHYYKCMQDLLKLQRFFLCGIPFFSTPLLCSDTILAFSFFTLHFAASASSSFFFTGAITFFWCFFCLCSHMHADLLITWSFSPSSPSSRLLLLM